MLRRRTASSLLAATIVITLGCAPLASQQECLKNAWHQLDAHDYEVAIEAANSCIDDFALAAKRMEDELHKKGVPLPSRKPSPRNIHEIVQQGILNDVPAAYIVKGKAAEALRKKGKTAAEKEELRQTAIKAYEAASLYKHALVWTPGQPPAKNKGWFWSPSEVASDSLARLKAEDEAGQHR